MHCRNKDDVCVNNDESKDTGKNRRIGEGAVGSGEEDSVLFRMSWLTFQRLELAGGQLRGPGRRQMLRSVTTVVFAGAQRGVTIEEESVEGFRVGACPIWEFERA